MQREVITSRDNARLVNARKVRDGRVRDSIFVEGRRLAGEAVRSGVAIEECLIAESFADRELIDAAAARCEVSVVADRLFASVADTDTPQGIVLIARRPVNTPDDVAARVASAAAPVVVFLKEANNPANLGAIFRTAEAAGVAGVIVSSGSADAYSPKALRGAMGANLRLPIVEGVAFDEALAWAREKGLLPTATMAGASASYVDLDWQRPRMLVLGSEAHGLSDEELAAVDETVSIPLANDVESLNLGVAAGILMFEARRQCGICAE
ncbi:MAG: RNA methyltransferase [Chloracidobacterium sp.]|nr:RNA methyltransferase [Chloracidobacterium sp.]